MTGATCDVQHDCEPHVFEVVECQERPGFGPVGGLVLQPAGRSKKLEYSSRPAMSTLVRPVPLTA